MANPPKPRDVHILEGTFRADRHGEDSEVVQAAGEPSKPSTLKGEALKLWESVVPQLVASGCAKERDTAELVQMCEWWGRYRKLSAALDKMGATNRKLPKLLTATLSAGRAFDQIASRFGLTPSDRQRLRITEAAKPAAVMTRKRKA